MGTESTRRPRRIAVAPSSGRFESLEAAVLNGGGELCDVVDAEALVWADPSRPHELPKLLAGGPGICWVALPFAGIEPYVPFLTDEHHGHTLQWTAAKGVYATPVAEHVIALALSGLRGIIRFARSDSWPPQVGRNLIGANVTVFGGGGITKELVRLLQPFNCHITVVRRSAEPFEGATRTLDLSHKIDAVHDADVVVVALALTPETRHVIDAAVLEAMPEHSWLVNVGRGGHVDQEALVSAIRSEHIGGAALDVTSPEPLPAEHELWALDRVLLSPHVGNTPEMGVPLLASHIERNVRNFVEGAPLEGLVDVSAGY